MALGFTWEMMLFGDSNNIVLPGDCTSRGGDVKASLEELLLPSYSDGVHRPNDDTLLHQRYLLCMLNHPPSFQKGFVGL